MKSRSDREKIKLVIAAFGAGIVILDSGAGGFICYARDYRTVCIVEEAT